ncbi:Mitochondrial import inner membrane translocase subunit tim-21 [Wickerhamomyces ciferrii]|uniref:Mitochondrial import inner membrane translocase subunit Tim21 n=1 Tax=Wickerhamomyces ciferrii (strain ATCC 14091 / BCRC 22168 / CBS 111 / JCM 3599 / NBRC 0793 / NRRL Y-1031 F-60-10) TaxID=1206466 RepID=K0KR48_WICCF|nr:Mitochondrial import inner membrane translocase subunit tim-21 [Wickerhamomyces ciferrii]CCH45631.1 Mitochondrial import inner membrane translocase subunit tim-21 [Wickerhamomyces ciferrii]
MFSIVTRSACKNAQRSILLVKTSPIKILSISNLNSSRSILTNRQYSSTTDSSNSSNSNTNQKTKKDSKPKIPLWARIKTASTFAIATTVVLGATGLAGLVIYLVVSEIVLPSGDTQVFNKAVGLIEKDEKCQELLNLEKGSRLKAYGESSDNKWTRNRPISSTRRMDKSGKEHLFMRFHVESPTKHGSVQLETIQADVLHPEYSYIYLDVPGEKRQYIINPPRPNLLGSRDQNTGFLGVKWGPKSS